MRQFRCESCGLPVYFRNSHCGGCGARLGFIPEELTLGAFRVDEAGNHLRYAVSDRLLKPCRNIASACGCNWMLGIDEAEALCRACRLTVTLPDQSILENQAAWRALEEAKQAWLYTILCLHLPARSRSEDPERGLAFHFLRQIDADKPVLTGHDAGVITINAIESDPVQRERSKHQLHEPYRTLLGHFRHESGHYYWDLLIRDSALVEPFRQLFGDERADYGQALERHYAQGPRLDWATGFVSGYATMHPWEDWAETWAHYLHMVDMIDTARSWQVSIAGFSDDLIAEQIPDRVLLSDEFVAILREWIPLTLFANNLNRSLGHADAYPFALSYEALRKMQFVHDVVRAFRMTAIG